MTAPATLFAAEQELTDLLGFYAAQAPGRRVRSVREFGAAIDGDTDDREGWQAAFDWAAGGEGRALYFPRGVSVISERLLAPDGLHLFGDGPNNSVLRCTATPDPPQLGAPIWLGNFHLFAVGHRLTGSGDPFATNLQSYVASAPISEGDTELTLDTAADAAEFAAGTIAFLRSQEQSIQINSGYDLVLPTDNSLVRVTSADALTGLVTFERPAGFDSATAPLLCRIADDAADPYGPIYFAQDVLIENMGFVGACAVGSNSAAAYDCHYRDIGGDVFAIIRCNNLAYCSVDGFDGIWREVMAEIKFGAHDTAVRNLRGTNPGAGANVVPIISLGEYCRDIEVLDFTVAAPNLEGIYSHVVGLQPGTNVTIRGTAYVPKLEAHPIVIYPDAVKSVRNFSIDLALVHNSFVTIYVPGPSGGAVELPHDGRVRVMSCSLSDAATQYALYADGGSRIDYSGHFTGSDNKGRIYWGPNATGNVALDCRTPEAIVESSTVNQALFGKTYSATAAPTGGTHALGDRVINKAPSPGGYMGWVCTSAGSPGTWKGFGTIHS